MERRTEPRMLCADLVDARWRDKTGKNRRTVANLEDISLSGACLQLDEQVPLGTLMTISHPKGEFTGMVRYCQFREIGYFIGLQFEPDSRWSQRVFKPLHLFDPRTLTKNKGGDTTDNKADSAAAH
jgi:hypothetical protein